MQILEGSNGQTWVESNIRAANDAAAFATCSMLPQGWVVEGAVCLWAEKRPPTATHAFFDDTKPGTFFWASTKGPSLTQPYVQIKLPHRKKGTRLASFCWSIVSTQMDIYQNKSEKRCSESWDDGQAMRCCCLMMVRCWLLLMWILDWCRRTLGYITLFVTSLVFPNVGLLAFMPWPRLQHWLHPSLTALKL